jgi:hypothetical protein
MGSLITLTLSNTMGVETALIASAIVGAASTGYGMYAQDKAAKQQAKAAEAMADAMEDTPTVQSSAVAQQTTEDTANAEQASDNEARRRASISSTLQNRSTAQSLLGGRKTLG